MIVLIAFLQLIRELFCFVCLYIIKFLKKERVKKMIKKKALGGGVEKKKTAIGRFFIS